MYRVEYGLEVLPESISVRGNALASGSIDHEFEDMIIAEIEAGSISASSRIRVTAHISGITGVEGIEIGSCCSYKDEKEFRKDALEGMRRCALNKLRAKLAEMHEATHDLSNFDRED